MIIDANELPKNHKIEADVCLIGGGVAGIVLANELIGKVGKVVVLEAGTQVYDTQVQEHYSANSISPGFPNTLYSRMRMLGGSSNHWENNTSPLSPIDFEKREWVKHSGWPISYDDLEPYYSKAQFYCGVEPDGYSLAYWQAQFGEEHPLKESDVLTSAMAKASLPPVRFFSDHGKALESSASAEVYVHANFKNVEQVADSGNIESVRFVCGDNNNVLVNAKLFVFCMGGIENARMLLHINRNYGNRFGNSNDVVGRYFMDHPVIRGAILYPKEREAFSFYRARHLETRLAIAFLSLTEKAQKLQKINNIRMPLIPANEYTLSDGIASYHVLTQAAKSGDWPDHFGKHLSNVVFDVDMVLEATYRKAFQEKLFESSEEFAGFSIPAMVEQTPSPTNRVKLSDKMDSFGIPKIDVEWKVSEEDKQQAWKALELAAIELGALGLGKIRLLSEYADRVWGDQLGFGHHHMGTTRMSTSEADGVVDSNSAVFGAPNLYIAGSSVFSTGGHVPPTLTITALCIRLSEHLLKVLSHE